MKNQNHEANTNHGGDRRATLKTCDSLLTENCQLKTFPRILFLDQTAQLGGAELCLKDLVLARMNTSHRVVAANNSDNEQSLRELAGVQRDEVTQRGITRVVPSQEARHQTDASQGKGRLQKTDVGSRDRVVLFQHGPFEELLLTAGVDTRVHCFGQTSQSLRKESGLFRKAVSSFDVVKLARVVAREAKDMDVLYANTPKALVVGTLAGWLAHKPVVYHLHDILSPEHFSQSNLWLVVAITNKFVAHVIANSEATAHAFKNAGGRTATSVCFNGFEPSTFDEYVANNSLHRASLLRELKLSYEPIIGVFGRFAPWKGQHVAIEALKRLPDVHLALVGDALFGEAAYKQELLRLAEQPGVAGRVHFLGFRDDVPALMQGTDVVVHCSTAPEPFGRVIVEAMFSRRPVIASGAGGAEEIVQDGVNGLLATPGDSSDLVRRIREILESEKDRNQMVEAGYRSAMERFQLAGVVKRIEEIVGGVAGG